MDFPEHTHPVELHKAASKLLVTDENSLPAYLNLKSSGHNMTSREAKPGVRSKSAALLISDRRSSRRGVAAKDADDRRFQRSNTQAMNHQQGNFTS